MGKGGNWLRPSTYLNKLKPDQSTDTTTNAPWAAAQPYWSGDNGIFARANTLSQQGPNADMTQGWNTSRAAINDPQNTALLGGSRDYANRVLSGEFLDSTKNMALAQQLQRGIEGMGAWDTGAVNAGRYGSGAWGEGRGRQLSDLQGNLYGQGLQQMTNMAGMAPSIYSSQMLPGSLQSALGQEQSNFDWQNLQRQAGLLQQAGGGQTTQPVYTPSTWTQLLAMGLPIARAGSQMMLSGGGSGGAGAGYGGKGGQ